MVGYACLMLAGGMNSLIIPIRGGSEGFSSLALGLLGTSWAIGFIIGALYVPSMVLRVGHVRVFSVMASMATLAVIISLVVIDPIVWIPMRAAAGFCFAGSAMIVESWVNERTNPQTRGKVFLSHSSNFLHPRHHPASLIWTHKTSTLAKSIF